MVRKAFNPDKDPAIDDAPSGKVMHGACFAHGCTMPGNVKVDGASWTCAWHYGVVPSDIPRVTQVLRDWECATYEIKIGRQALCSLFAADPKKLDELFTEALARMAAATSSGSWGDQFERQSSEDYRRWLNRLEVFVGRRIAQTLGSTPEVPA